MWSLRRTVIRVKMDIWSWMFECWCCCVLIGVLKNSTDDTLCPQNLVVLLKLFESQQMPVVDDDDKIGPTKTVDTIILFVVHLHTHYSQKQPNEPFPIALSINYMNLSTQLEAELIRSFTVRSLWHCGGWLMDFAQSINERAILKVFFFQWIENARCS